MTVEEYSIRIIGYVTDMGGGKGPLKGPWKRPLKGPNKRLMNVISLELEKTLKFIIIISFILLAVVSDKLSATS